MTKWNEKEAAHYSATAKRCFEHSYDHGTAPDPDNCSGCAIRGCGTEDGLPNYCGWARCYVEARMPIPKAWQKAYLAELKSSNIPYRQALRTSIRTFGNPLWED